MNRLSVCLITLNEERNLPRALCSVQGIANEIVVVDCGSSDRTQEIAREHGARVIARAWTNFAEQKNSAAAAATHDWILSMDADEEVSPELRESLLAWKQQESQIAVYEIARCAWYLGAWIKHSGWYPDRKIRLYDRRLCRWEGEFVHEWLKVDGAVSAFKGDLLHFPYRDWNDHAARIARYSELAARAARSSGRRGNIGRLLLAPPLVFLKAFLLRAGFLDGWRGLAIAYMGARYVFQKEFRILR